MAKVAINGLGRIGRATLKIVMDTPGLDLVAANDIGASDNVEYLLKYDTVYGRYEKTVEATDDGHLTVGGHRLTLLREKDPARLPWKSLNVDVVFECTGAFTRREDLDRSHPCRSPVRHPVGTLEKRRCGNDRPRRQYAAGGHRHHLVRELHDELHHAGDGDSRAADRRQEGHHDYSSRLHVQSGDCRLSAQSRAKRPGRRREPRTHVHRRGGRDRQGATRISRPIRWCGRPGARRCRVARGHRRRRGQTDDGGRGEPMCLLRRPRANAIAASSV